MSIHKSFIILFIFFSITVESKEHIGPNAPKHVFRIETRTPQDMFVAGGAGFQSWRQLRGTPGPGPNLMQHIAGSSIREQSTDFVSTTGSLMGVEILLNNYTSGPRRPLWVYQISPNEDAYNLNWCWEDMSALTRYQSELYRRYQNQDEWAFLGGIRLNQIQSAQRHVWSERYQTYLEDESSGSLVSNPHYAPTPRPQPQRINPMRERLPQRFTTFFGYEPHDATPSPGLPSLETLSTLGASCLGAAFPLSYSKKKRSLSPKASQYSKPIIKESDCLFSNSKEFKLDAPTIPSSVILTSDSTGVSQCLIPQSEYHWQTKKWNIYWLGVSPSDKRCTQYQAIYDFVNRLGYYYHETDFCPAISPEFASGQLPKQLLTFEVCDHKSPLQKFIVRDGKLIPLVRQNAHVYLDNPNYAWVGTQTTKYHLDQNLMAKNFFDEPSLPTNYLTEIGLAWVFQNQFYYSTPTSWSSSYDYPTYYDDETHAIFLMDSENTDDIIYPRPRCLKSHQTPGSFFNWYWADWPNCFTRAKKAKPYLSWILTPEDRHYLIKDGWNNDLWITVIGKNAGNYFTSVPWVRTYRNSGTWHVFTAAWKEGCEKKDKPWVHCIPKLCF